MPASNGQLVELTPAVQALVDAYAKPLIPPPPAEGVETVRVDSAMSRVAFVYEKVRNAVEYRETHLLRRAAIYRILKRRLITDASFEDLAYGLLRELIRGRYLPNATYPSEIVGELATLLENYKELRRVYGHMQPVGKERRDAHAYVLQLATSAVEEFLVSPAHVEALVEAAKETYEQVIEIRHVDLSESEYHDQLYVAIHQVLPKSDINTIRYRFFKRRLTKWDPLVSVDYDVVQEIAKQLQGVREDTDAILRHSMQERLQRKLRRQVAPFVVLKAICERHGAKATQVLQRPDLYETEIRDTANALYAGVKDRIRRSAVRSIIYLFVTKMAVGALIEVPYDLYVIGEIHVLPIIINVLFPPFLVFLIALWIRLPGEGNTQKIIQRLWGATYGAHGGIWQIQIRPPRQRKGWSRFWFILAYVVTMLIVYGGSAWVLMTFLNFTIVSVLIFLFFLSVVSFFGYRIRQAVRELLLATRREGVIALVFDFLSIPLLRVGRFLSINFSKFNVAAFLLDVILEAPFKTVVDFFEDWMAYLREKREEIS